MWPEHGVALEARAFRLDILEDEGEVPRRRDLLLGGPKAETPALFNSGHFAHYLANFARMPQEAHLADIPALSKAQRRT